MAPIKSLLPADEADERLRIADILLARSQQQIPGRSYTRIGLAIFAAVPLHRLHWAEQNVDDATPVGLDLFVNVVADTVRTCKSNFESVPPRTFTVRQLTKCVLAQSPAASRYLDSSARS